MSDSVRPHRRQPTKLPRPWDSPGKNTGVGCHFLLQCMKVRSESEKLSRVKVKAQSCPTLSDLMDCSLSGPSVHGIFQARVLEWGAIAFPEEYTEELYKKDLHDPDNHDGVITDLEPDILECEVKWDLGSITTNKASGGDEIPVGSASCLSTIPKGTSQEGQG